MLRGGHFGIRDRIGRSGNDDDAKTDLHADSDHALELSGIEGAAAILIIARKDFLGRGADARRLELQLDFLCRWFINNTLLFLR